MQIMIWCQYPKTIHHLSLLFCSQGCQPFCEYQQWSVACHQNQNHDNILDARHLQCKPRRWRLQFVPTKKSFRIRFSESNEANLFLSLPCSCQQGGNYTSEHGNLEVEDGTKKRHKSNSYLCSTRARGSSGLSHCNSRLRPLK